MLNSFHWICNFTSALERDPRLGRREVVWFAGGWVTERSVHPRNRGVAAVELVREEANAIVESLLLFVGIKNDDAFSWRVPQSIFHESGTSMSRRRGGLLGYFVFCSLFNPGAETAASSQVLLVLLWKTRIRIKTKTKHRTSQPTEFNGMSNRVKEILERGGD